MSSSDSADREFVVDCGDCERRGSAHCDDCVVSFVLDREPGAIVFDAAEERALRMLSRAGLLPEVRLKRKIG